MRARESSVRVLDENFQLTGNLLHLQIVVDGRFITAELVDRAEVTVAAAPFLPSNGGQACVFDLTRLRVDGRYSILLRANDDRRHLFGERITRQTVVLGGTIAVREAVSSAFVSDDGSKSASVYVDFVRRRLFLQLAPSSVDLSVGRMGRNPATITRPVSMPPSKDAIALGAKLWGGFSRPAIPALEKLFRSTSPVDRYGAAACLARWYARVGDHARALDFVGAKHAISRSRVDSKETLLIEAECLLRLGRVGEARRVLRHGMTIFGEIDGDLCIAYANTLVDEADDRRLNWINRVFAEGGFAPIEKANAEQALRFENLAAPTAVGVRDSDHPKVSVIMPIYNAEATIRTALTSVLRQTWSNLEIIVVDDCSTDDTLDIARSIARDDGRIRVIRQDRNQGAYVARNAGLAQTTGELITTHDGDDWSHPQKVEAQVRSMLSRAGTRGSITNWTRVTRDLSFPGARMPGDSYFYANYSSFLFTRDVAAQLGGWDRVRASADSEFIRFAETVFGRGSFVGNHVKVPLAFGLSSGKSLTRHTETHVDTVDFGVRRDYHEAAAWWREKASDAQQLRLDPTSNARPFPAPVGLLPDKPSRPRYDFLIIMDFNMVGGAYQSTMNYLRACLAGGKRVAVFHWRRFTLDVLRPLNPRMWDLAADGQIDIIIAGERIAADVVLIGYPVILQYPIDRPPIVNFKHLVVIVNQMAFRLHGGRDRQYDPVEVAANLLETFGTVGVWAPISGLVRRLMLEIPGYPRPHDDTWLPLIDLTALATDPPVWRGATRGQPVIGRHCRDHYTKWPSTRLALLDAYCADKPCIVKLLGGVEKALAVIGAKPSNWFVYAFDSISPNEFLRDIDIFIHYTHEAYIEEFGRAVIEAMAAGRPVILPPVFRETFGDAALYVEPHEVWETARRLWQDETEYMARARAGREFVWRNCAFDQLDTRLEKLK